jgi:predicted metal-binding membrane protein
VASSGKDRAVVGAALFVLTALAWIYVIDLARQMDMGGMDMTGFRMAAASVGMIMTPALEPWTVSEFFFTLAMWVVMMVGMMTPSAAPMILLYARVGRQAAIDGKSFASTSWFTGGYLIAWAGFALLATMAQWALDRASLLTPAMASASAILGGIFLIGAGLYQWTSLKDRCLVQCQSPIQFIQRHGGFRRDPRGSLGMGVTHGFYCVGCCWALMSLLFVGGVMNLLWIAGIAALALIEKLVPAGHWIPRAAGVVFILGGISLIL